MISQHVRLHKREDVPPAYTGKHGEPVTTIRDSELELFESNAGNQADTHRMYKYPSLQK